MRSIAATLGPVLPLFVAGAVLCGCSTTSDANPTAAQSLALQIPLASSTEASIPGAAPTLELSSSAWAIVPMGELGKRAGTFWQVFVLAGGRSSWSLVTPAGVADNGGLVGSFVSGDGLVGVEPSALLGYSPVASTGDLGRGWLGGILPGPLAPVPDSVASAPGGRLLALLGATGTSIVSSLDDASSQTSLLSSFSAVSKVAAGSCDLTALTAVAYGPQGQPMAGGRCQGSSHVGIFEATGKRWRLVGPPVPVGALTEGATSSAAIAGFPVGNGPVVTEVLRLSSNGSKVMALAEAAFGDGTASLFRLTWTATRTWIASPVFVVPPSKRVVATGEEPDGSGFVLMATARGAGTEARSTLTLPATGHLSAAVLPADGSRWSKPSDVPAGTATLALGVGGTIEALAVSRSTLTVYALGHKGTWTPLQVLSVRIGEGPRA